MSMAKRSEAKRSSVHDGENRSMTEDDETSPEVLLEEARSPIVTSASRRRRNVATSPP
jgi:hypothetical protein